MKSLMNVIRLIRLALYLSINIIYENKYNYSTFFLTAVKPFGLQTIPDQYFLLEKNIYGIICSLKI